ncbi:TetR/AcrR family transcriptional regulator C-terminal domain-containing protein [Xanthobacter dioxanivorans]|uniref:TetR/AcrR family transcriptional regulator C-terminal domain-containing protein n=1 Tax=Xanthobacter dioxanivorans TaxID=2528964 RepID=A0A974SL51_9HYPH|nr:TetR/AcrR family transcriptional regulator [Xanthobacter dioxanivorans]QRG09202.1 TetR/AcrR family transcriptional regulator C-terminal domain-containing protein [Xanthobacter dioxanivorans]
MNPATPRPVAPRRRDPRGTAARIRAAARRLFLEKGYEATAMDAVAAAAPVSKRTLYQHFSSKAELFGAVIDEAWSHFTRAPMLPSDTTGDPRAVLRAYVGRLTEHWDRPDVIPLLRLVIAEAPRFPELSHAYFAAGKEPAVKGLSAYLASLAGEGRLAPGLDPQLAAAQFLGAIKEPLFWPRVLGVPAAFDGAEAMERAIDTVLRQG